MKIKGLDHEKIASIFLRHYPNWLHVYEIELNPNPNYAEFFNILTTRDGRVHVHISDVVAVEEKGR